MMFAAASEPVEQGAFLFVWTLSTSVAVLSVAAWRWRRGLPLVRFEPRAEFPRSLATDLVMALLIGFVVLGISGQVVKSFQGAHDNGRHAADATSNDAAATNAADDDSAAEPGPLLGSAALTVIIVLVIAGVLNQGAKFTLFDFGLPTQRIGYDALLSVIGFICVLGPVVAIQVLTEKLVPSVPYEHPLINAYLAHRTVATAAALTVTAVIVAPITEEFLFRVLLQGWFESLEATRRAAASKLANAAATPDAPEQIEPSAGDRIISRQPPGWLGSWPVLASAALFALMHWGQGLAPIPLFVFALVLGFLYQRTHRIWPSMIAHMLLNGLTMATLLVSPPPDARPAATTISRPSAPTLARRASEDARRWARSQNLARVGFNATTHSSPASSLARRANDGEHRASVSTLRYDAALAVGTPTTPFQRRSPV